MAKSRYENFSKEQMSSFIQQASTMEEVLELMGYNSPRNLNYILAVRRYCQKLEIQNEQLPNFRETIKCNKCGQYKEKEDFYFSNGKLAQKVCKECVRKKEREKYQETHLELIEFKKAHPCKKCGCSKHYLIDFHHLNPTEKDFAISSNTHAKFETLKKEIDKCIPLCSNCHREFHYLENQSGIDIQEYLKNNYD